MERRGRGCDGGQNKRERMEEEENDGGRVREGGREGEEWRVRRGG